MPLQYDPPASRSAATVRFQRDLRVWLEDPSSGFHQQMGYLPSTRRIGYHYQLSPSSHLTSHEEPGQIVLLQQFYVAEDGARHAENQTCLRYNVGRREITDIVLLNERLYDEHELGIGGLAGRAKVRQVLIGERLTFRLAFEHARRSVPPDSFVVLANTDIFLTIPWRECVESS